MKRLMVSNHTNLADLPRLGRGPGIWADGRTARHVLAHTTRAAMHARRPGDGYATALDADILDDHTQSDGWTIPIVDRGGRMVARIDVVITVQTLFAPYEVHVCGTAIDAGYHMVMAAMRIAVSHRLSQYMDLVDPVRDLIRALTLEADRQAVSTAGRISGPRPGPQRETAGSRRGDPSQPGRSLELFGAENRT